ncbi:MAG TPA: DUF4038 domain-containing protein [Bacteroidales bacterium]|nr:DUF4038 domain-containing protein [Bacteroidales bacterium]
MRHIIATAILFATTLFAQNIDDSLIGSSHGIVSGGTFTDAGWKTKSVLDFIQYNVPTSSNGVVEFDVKGIEASNVVFPNCDVDKYGNINCAEDNVHYQLINFWDRDDSTEWWGVKQWHNPYKMYIQIYGYTYGDVDKWQHIEHRLNVCAYSGGYEDDPHAFGNPPLYGPFNWNKDVVYHFKMTWGMGHFILYMNGSMIVDRDYSSFGCEYTPPYFSIRLGSAVLGGIKSGGLKCPVGITYSNFKFVVSSDVVPPSVIAMEYTKEEQKLSVTGDILVTFSKPMSLESIRTGISIEPVFPYVLEMSGNTICVRNIGILPNNTSYRLILSSTIKDLSGNLLDKPYVYNFVTNEAFPNILSLYTSHDFPIQFPNINYLTNFSGTFTSGDRTITLDGFWDNYKIGKVRFSPDRVGTWTYNINGITGSFNCIASDSKGFIHVSGTKFVHSDGTNWPWLGDTSWRLATMQFPYNGRFKNVVDVRAQQDYTAIQFIINSYINGLGFWKNEGGTCFDESNGAKNYDALNPEYFRWLDRRVNYAVEHGLVPVMFLSWAQEYALYSESQWTNYVEYVVGRYAAKNVVWIICGEYNELPNDFPGRTVAEFNIWGSLIKSRDPYNHPMSMHPSGRGSSAEFAGSQWMNFIGQQTPYAATAIGQDIGYGIPVINLEPTYFYPDEYGSPTTTEQVRRQLYDIVKAGGYYTSGFYTTYAPDKGGYDIVALASEQHWVAVLNKLIKEGRVPTTYEEYVAICDEVPVSPALVPNKVKGLRIL